MEEARAWIAAWKDRQQNGASQQNGATPVPKKAEVESEKPAGTNVAEAREWIAAWKSKQ